MVPSAREERGPHPVVPGPDELIADPGRLTRRFRVTVIGDVRVDLRASLQRHRFIDLSDDAHEQVQVRTSIGGTAMGFARSATAHFEQVVLLGAIGDDSWTEAIHRGCRQPGMVDHLVETGRANSPVVALRDRRASGAKEGIRLLVADSPAPYDDLDEAMVESAAADIAGSDALVLDGYALLSEPSARAVRRAGQIAATAGIPVAFDVVPHRIDEHLKLLDFADVLCGASMIWVEADTIKRLLHLPVHPTQGVPDVVALLGKLPAPLRTRNRTWFVRYGTGQMDRTVAMAFGHHAVEYCTGYAAAPETAAYGYRVAAAELKWWLANAHAAAARYGRGVTATGALHVRER